MQSYGSVRGNTVDDEGVKDVIEEHSTFLTFNHSSIWLKMQGKKTSSTGYLKCHCQIGPTQAPNSTELYVKLESDYDKLVEHKQFQCQLSFIWMSLFMWLMYPTNFSPPYVCTRSHLPPLV